MHAHRFLNLLLLHSRPRQELFFKFTHHSSLFRFPSSSVVFHASKNTDSQSSQQFSLPASASSSNKRNYFEFKNMSLTKECCNRPAIKSDYEAIGTDFELNDLTIYQTGDITSKRVLISVYDILGFHPNIKQFCDQIAKDGFLVAMPGFFRGGSKWKAADLPPKNMQDIIDWFEKEGSFANVEPDIRSVIDHYKRQGATAFGIFGFCWGGKISAQAGGVLSDDIKGAALIHPSLINEHDVDAINCPVIFLPSKNEGDMIPFQQKVQKRLGIDAAEHYRLDDMEHGFAGARGDFKNELNRKRVEEVIELTSKFFNKHIKE